MSNFPSLTNLFEMVGASFILILGLMSILWLLYCMNRNVGIVDIGWATSFLLIAWAYALIGKGYFPRKIVFTILVTLWAGRLSWHIIQRYLTTAEDTRYEEIRNHWGGVNVDFRFLLMFLFQGFLTLVLSIPFLIVCRNESPFWSQFEVWGILVCLIGIIGETYADTQLKAFKKNPYNATKVCQDGLWNYSRHPNYFFEWIVWVGFFIFALGSPGGFVAIISPAIILFLVLKVSGIPLTEEHALRTKGDAYREYQRTTSAFIPWFKKH
jgi:steroid 5-alpha reductase family enzyme